MIKRIDYCIVDALLYYFIYFTRYDFIFVWFWSFLFFWFMLLLKDHLWDIYWRNGRAGHSGNIPGDQRCCHHCHAGGHLLLVCRFWIYHYLNFDNIWWDRWSYFHRCWRDCAHCHFTRDSLEPNGCAHHSSHCFVVSAIAFAAVAVTAILWCFIMIKVAFIPVWIALMESRQWSIHWRNSKICKPWAWVRRQWGRSLCHSSMAV